MNLMQLMNNPQVKMIMNSKNPQETALNMLKNSPNANTEIGRNIINMLENGDTKGIEQYGKNLVQSQGGSIQEIENFFRNNRF